MVMSFLPPAVVLSSVKTSVQNIDNTTFVNVTSVLLTLPANSTWFFICGVSYDSPTDEDAKFQFTVPASATLNMIAHTSAVNLANALPIGNIAASTPVLAGGAEGVITLAARFEGIITIGATAGAVQLQAAQNAQVDADDLNVHSGYILGWRLS